MTDFIVFLLNCTWGIIQSGIGLIMFLLLINKPHYRYKGSIVTAGLKPSGSGVSLGVFIFIGYNITKEQASRSSLVNHEYGHSLQSLLLGPLYLIIIGLPDIIWLMLFSGWRTKRHKSYYSFFSESWADKWGNVKRGAEKPHKK